MNHTDCCFKVDWVCFDGMLRAFSRLHPEIKFIDNGLNEFQMPSWKIETPLTLEERNKLFEDSYLLTIFGINYMDSPDIISVLPSMIANME